MKQRPQWEIVLPKPVINTKYWIGQTVFVLTGSNFLKVEVFAIQAAVTQDKKQIVYTFRVVDPETREPMKREEDDIFETRQHLIDAIFRK